MANFVNQIIQELETFFAPLTATGGDTKAIFSVLSAAGWPIERVAGIDNTKLVASFGTIINKVNALATLAASPPDETLTLLAKLGETLEPLFAEIANLKDGLPTGLPADRSDLPADVIGFLTVTYLNQRTAPTFHTLRALGVIADADPQPAQSGGQVYRFRNGTPRLRPKQLVDLISQPAATFRGTYWPGGFSDGGAGATALGLKLLDLAASLGVWPDNSRGAGEGEHAPVFGVKTGADTLGLSYSVLLDDGAETSAGARLALGVDSSGVPTVQIQPFGAASLSATLSRWTLSLTGDIEANPFEVSSAGFRQLDANKPPFKADLTLARGDATNPAFLFGAAKGTSIAIDKLSVFFSIALGSSTPEVVFGFELEPIRFRIGLGGADGFLSATMPSQGIAAQADVGLQYSNKTGVTFRGSVALTVDLADQIELGPVTIRGLTIALAPKDSTLNTELAATVGAKIGPAAGVVEGIGIKLGITAPDGGGNLGPLDVALGFKPPKGLGLVIDASVIKGGGYLFIDTDRGEYAGTLELAFAAFSLKAIAILTTKRPDGSKGWSLLLMVYGQFPSPIQLSYGFTLSGVGGLIGLHHGCDRPRLEDGMRTGAFDAVLFPRDPVGDAPTIISQLRVIFPIRPNALLIGPMLEIGWSTPNIIKVRLGVLIQLDNVFGGGSLAVKQILILGQLEAILPPGVDADKALLRLLIDFLGYVDLDEKVIGFEARLRDSRVSTITLTGMFVVRVVYRDPGSFILAAGGFHPDFKDLPPGLPSPIDRIGAGFTIGPVDIAILGYFAATPATVQAGARVQAEARISGASVSGHFNFDTIFYFEPSFHFQVGADCGFAVAWHGHKLAGVDFHGTFTGPGRWHIAGKAEFSILFCSVTLPIDSEWGDAPPTPVIPAIDVRAILEGDLANPDLWSAQEPAGGAALVTLTARATDGTAMAHPLSSLTFSQRRVPLQLDLQRFGRAPISGETRMDFTLVRISNTVVQPNYVSQYFARSNFIDIAKDEALSHPSFEPLPGGLEIGSDAFSVAPDLAVPLDFETAYLDADQPTAVPKRDSVKHGLPFDHLMKQIAHADVARSRLRRREKMMPPNPPAIAVSEAPYAAAKEDTMKAAAVPLSGSAIYSRTLAEQSKPPASLVVESYELAGT